ncbi:helix-hairpin-helix domain-containing protein [uncultured Maribacter sp.]|uniref:ComEA family DNA-binding protein n=1 Tax=uncultured Maribacter sp. TaxID=431308 RepID=UPI0026117618|nr:helix-hairpin-helix domain-containing protein [uncultured Maribacter sp.]
MNSFKSHFKFNKEERSGIFFFLFFLIAVQLGYYFYNKNTLSQAAPLQFESGLQAEIDSLKILASIKDSVRIYPFNPNFITDFKGYTIGMSVEEIDRLHKFRKKDKYVNSAKEFQDVTKISDSLLKALTPFFKFPEWTQGKRRKTFNASTSNNKVDEIIWKDLNTATAEDLKTINGIGEKLSARIIKFRDCLGGFLIDDQLNDVYGLEPEVVERALERFKVLTKPNIIKINVNTATVEELSKLIYL